MAGPAPAAGSTRHTERRTDDGRRTTDDGRQTTRQRTTENRHDDQTTDERARHQANDHTVTEENGQATGDGYNERATNRQMDGLVAGRRTVLTIDKRLAISIDEQAFHNALNETYQMQNNKTVHMDIR